MARIIEPTSQHTFRTPVEVSKLDSSLELVLPKTHLPQKDQSGLLDDDMIPDSRIYSRPAAIVEAKLASRINASSRYAVE